MGPVTPRVTLREVRDTDLPILFEHQRDPEANRMANFPARDRDAFMAHWTRILGDESCVTRAVDVDGEVAGNVGSWEQDGERDVGYWVGREHWGKGVATEALRAFLSVLEERPLFAYVVEHNVGSIRVLEKNGFRPIDRSELPEGGTELRYCLDRAPRGT